MKAARAVGFSRGHSNLSMHGTLIPRYFYVAGRVRLAEIACCFFEGYSIVRLDSCLAGQDGLRFIAQNKTTH